MNNIFEVLAYGPILASHEEHGVLVTANASYLNLWVASEHDESGCATRWTNTDARAVGEERGLDALQLRAEEWVADLSGDEPSDA